MSPASAGCLRRYSRGRDRGPNPGLPPFASTLNQNLSAHVDDAKTLRLAVGPAFNYRTLINRRHRPFTPVISIHAMIRSYRRRLLLFVAIGIVIFIYHFRYETRSLFPLPGLSSNDVSGSSVEHQAPAAPVVSQNAEFAVDSNAPRVRQVTMLYEGDSDHLRSLYLRCITTYKRYGERWGFPTHVLEHGLVGDYSFFNKPAYVLSTMMTELAKPHEERAHWIV